MAITNLHNLAQLIEECTSRIEQVMTLTENSTNGVCDDSWQVLHDLPEDVILEQHVRVVLQTGQPSIEITANISDGKVSQVRMIVTDHTTQITSTIPADSPLHHVAQVCAETFTM